MLAWEWGRERHPVDRALVLLGVAHPGCSREQLARLSVGQRDALLLRLRERLFGGTLELQARCPGCEEGYQFDVPVQALLLRGDSLEPDDAPRVLEALPPVYVRLPNSVDLAAVAAVPDPRAARAALVRRCLVDEDTPVTAELVERVAAFLIEQDPQTDLRFPLTCDICGVDVLVDLDVGGFLWEELNGWARRTMREVALLADRFGWNEADILVMSDARRAAYVELANA